MYNCNQSGETGAGDFCHFIAIQADGLKGNKSCKTLITLDNTAYPVHTIALSRESG
jgi:hypothetical protein